MRRAWALLEGTKFRLNSSSAPARQNQILQENVRKEMSKFQKCIAQRL